MVQRLQILAIHYNHYKEHKKINVFSDLGNADLTARVNFEHLANLSKDNKMSVTSVITQGEFLCNMGIKASCRKPYEGKTRIKEQYSTSAQ